MFNDKDSIKHHRSIDTNCKLIVSGIRQRWQHTEPSWVRSSVLSKRLATNGLLLFVFDLWPGPVEYLQKV
jgi:hypothetical protein